LLRKAFHHVLFQVVCDSWLVTPASFNQLLQIHA